MTFFLIMAGLILGIFSISGTVHANDYPGIFTNNDVINGEWDIKYYIYLPILAPNETEPEKLHDGTGFLGGGYDYTDKFCEEHPEDCDWGDGDGDVDNDNGGGDGGDGYT